MRRVPLQRGQQRTSVRKVRLRSWAQGMGRRGGWEGGGWDEFGQDAELDGLGEPVKTSLTLLLGVGPCQALTARL
jgi:hypothetical protein